MPSGLPRPRHRTFASPRVASSNRRTSPTSLRLTASKNASTVLIPFARWLPSHSAIHFVEELSDREDTDAPGRQGPNNCRVVGEVFVTAHQHVHLADEGCFDDHVVVGVPA